VEETMNYRFDRAVDGVKRALSEGIIPKQKLLLGIDAPFIYPKVTDK
jgi:hypothetical protein